MEVDTDLILILIITAVLAVCSISDLRARRIHLLSVSVGGIAAAVCLLTGGWPAAARGAAGMLPGALLYICSRATGGKIGTGDAAVLTVIGMGTGLIQALLILCTGFALTAVPAGYLCFKGKSGRNTRLPFVPFLFAAYLLDLLACR